MNVYIKVSLLACIIVFCFVAVDAYASKKKEVLKVLDIKYSDSTARGSCRDKGVLTIYKDYSFKINSSNREVVRMISRAIKEVLKKGEAFYKYENMEDGKLVMYGETLKKGDKNFIYALIEETEQKLNSYISSGLYRLEYR